MYYTSVLGAECIALLCSVSRVASARYSFSKVIFNDVLVSEQHTFTSSEHFHLEEGETMLARGNENVRAPGENHERSQPFLRL